MRILSLIILTFLGNSAFAECPFTDRTAENSIRTYQQCIEDGLAPSADIKAALAPATEDKALEFNPRYIQPGARKGLA